MAGLSDNGRLLIDLLTWRLRVVAAPQLCDRVANSNRELRRLVTAGDLATTKVQARLYDLQQPLCVMPPETPPPDLGELVWQLRRRRERTRPISTRIYWATRQAVARYGGVGGRIRQPLQVEHDLGTAGVYLARGHADSDHNRPETWFGEDAARFLGLIGRGGKTPDAVLLDDRRRLQTAIEFCGQYGHRRLRQLCRCWSRRRISLELW